MIQDIYPKKLNNSYRLDAHLQPESIILVFDSGKFLLKIDEESATITYPKCKDFDCQMEAVYLFSVDNEDYFYWFDYKNSDYVNTDVIDGVDIADRFESLSGYSFYDMRAIRRTYLSPKHYVFAAFTAYQLIEWYLTTKYCGRCGAENENSKTERARVCPKCGNIIYPRINPAVIVGVTNGDKLLLTKYRNGLGFNALVAGFTEIGETMEETVAREVMEETGLNVKNIRYYKSQPWGIASDILLGYYCDVDGDDTITMDENELKYAQWVMREDIELQPMDYSLTNEMMMMFKDNKI